MLFSGQSTLYFNLKNTPCHWDLLTGHCLKKIIKFKMYWKSHFLFCAISSALGWGWGCTLCISHHKKAGWPLRHSSTLIYIIPIFKTQSQSCNSRFTITSYNILAVLCKKCIYYKLHLLCSLITNSHISQIQQHVIMASTHCTGLLWVNQKSCCMWELLSRLETRLQ